MLPGFSRCSTADGRLRVGLGPLDDAELMSFRVAHDGGPEVSVVFPDERRAEGDKAYDFDIDVVHEEVEVSAVLVAFGLGYPLQREVMEPTSIGRREQRVVRSTRSGGFPFLVSQSVMPERGDANDVIAVQREPKRCVHHLRSILFR